MMAHIMKRASHMDRGPLIHMTIVFITCVPKNQFLYWWHVARPNIWWCRDTQISRKRMAVWFPAVKSPLYLTCNLLGGLLPSVLWRWHVNLVSQGKGGGGSSSTTPLKTPSWNWTKIYSSYRQCLNPKLKHGQPTSKRSSRLLYCNQHNRQLQSSSRHRNWLQKKKIKIPNKS